jgi:hypothetical protein
MGASVNQIMGIFNFQICQITKKEQTRKKYGLSPPKKSETDIVQLVHGLCGSIGFIYVKDTIQNTLSVCFHNDRSRNTAKADLKFLNQKISQQRRSRICFTTSKMNWHAV